MHGTTHTPLILVVDDEWMNRELMEAALATIGYRTLLASSGEIAVRLASEHQPDLALVDLRIRMPDDGLEVCRQLLEACPTLRVVIISALELPDSRERALAAGAADFITRSLDIPSFLAYITRAVVAS